MGSLFQRRFTFVPGISTLTNIESINILDLTPPAPIQGVGTGTVLLVGEFENGPFNQATEVTSGQDLASTFGSLGYTYGTTPGNNPSAPQRFADSAVVGELWNGNGFVALNGKQFSRLLVCRVNTSVGSVSFSALAYLTSTIAGPTFQLATGQVLQLTLSGTTSATFTGVPATVSASGGTYPTTFTGGQTLTLGYDAAPNFVVTFQSGDQSVAQVAARINTFAGFTFATVTGGQLVFTAVQGGTGGQVRVVAGSTGVLTQLGLTAGTTNGTGNVANILAVTVAEVTSVVQGAIAGTRVEQDANGFLRISNTATPLTGTITVAGATTATGLGFAIGATNSAASTPGGTIPAGTIVEDSGASNVLVTMQDVVVNPSAAGPYSVPVRYAVDTGTGAGTTAGTIVKIPTPPAIGSFSVNNAANITAALTESQIDAQYVQTLAPGGPTTDLNSIAKVTNIVWSARHSNAVRLALRNNAQFASSNGCFGRMAVVSPPLNTSPMVAQQNAGPGVVATRDPRTIYCYVGANTLVPLIAQVGVAGGLGFNASGNIDQTSDGWMASILSQLNPEENPGQDTPFTGAVNGIELGANVQGFSMANYQAFKAAGIAALRMDTDAGEAIFQSGITSVNPLTDPAHVTIARQRMADFIGDSIAQFAQGYGKKLNTRARRLSFKNAIKGFLNNLLSPNNPAAQRIGGYTVDDSGNTQDTIAQGLYFVNVSVQTLASMDSIVIALTAGANVSVTVSLPQAA